MINLSRINEEIKSVTPVTIKGRLLEISGPVLRATVTGAAIGDLVSIKTRRESKKEDGSTRLLAQVVGFSRHVVVLSPLSPPRDIVPGAEVELLREPLQVFLGPHLLGTVINALGEELYREETTPPPLPSYRASIFNSAPSPLIRKPIDQVFVTGVRAIDTFLTLGCGQRLSVLAEPGVGKSTLLAMIAKNSSADINVFGLIGERGREVQELLFDTLDAETRKRSVVVVSTSDESPLSRIRAAYTATRVAEYFRDQGLRVLLEIDSLTRLFRAFREVGLAAGEVPVRRGYPPSVFAALPELIERSGTNQFGSITALYTVLLSSDLDEDPMVDEIKSLTDGHLLLTRALSESGHYPAIDILGSVSRLASKLQDGEMKNTVRKLKRLFTRLEKDRDLISLGGQIDDELEQALRVEMKLLEFLQQEVDDYTTFSESHERLSAIFEQY